MKRRQKAEGWIDFHAHYSLPRTEVELEASLQLMHLGCFMASHAVNWSAEETLAHMDRNGVAMQLLSNIPKSLDALQASNDLGASIVREHSSRFGLLAALPTDNPDAAVVEVERTISGLSADGFAVTCNYNNIMLGDPIMDPLWAELDRRAAVVFVHPDAYAFPSLGRPAALLEVAFETARALVNMLYAGVFRRFPSIRFVVAHCGGALPALAGRLALLGAEPWVPNPHHITQSEIQGQLGRLFFDTAATGTGHSLRAALAVTTCDHLVYGSDCGVPCTTDSTMVANIDALLSFPDLSEDEIQAVGTNALKLLPQLSKRLAAQPVGAQR